MLLQRFEFLEKTSCLEDCLEEWWLSYTSKWLDQVNALSMMSLLLVMKLSFIGRTISRTQSNNTQHNSCLQDGKIANSKIANIANTQTHTTQHTHNTTHTTHNSCRKIAGQETLKHSNHSNTQTQKRQHSKHTM